MGNYNVFRPISIVVSGSRDVIPSRVLCLLFAKVWLASELRPLYCKSSGLLLDTQRCFVLFSTLMIFIHLRKRSFASICNSPTRYHQPIVSNEDWFRHCSPPRNRSPNFSLVARPSPVRVRPPVRFGNDSDDGTFWQTQIYTCTKDGFHYRHAIMQQ